MESVLLDAERVCVRTEQGATRLTFTGRAVCGFPRWERRSLKMLERVENTFSLNYPVELLELPEQKIHIERILRMIAKHSELIDMKFGVGETVLSYNEEGVAFPENADISQYLKDDEVTYAFTFLSTLKEFALMQGKIAKMRDKYHEGLARKGILGENGGTRAG